MVPERIDDYRWRIPKTYKPGMRVDGIIYASEKMLEDIMRDKAVEQVANVAYLPGIVGHSFGMPDIHWIRFCYRGCSGNGYRRGRGYFAWGRRF